MKVAYPEGNAPSFRRLECLLATSPRIYGSPGWIFATNPSLIRQVLYMLSYEAIFFDIKISSMHSFLIQGWSFSI